MKLINLAIRFMLELCMLAAFGYWGFRTGQTQAVRYLLGIGIPLLAAIVWGTFLSPKASIPVPPALQLFMEIALFGLAAAGLYAIGRPGLGITILVVFAVNRTLLYVWNQ